MALGHKRVLSTPGDEHGTYVFSLFYLCVTLRKLQSNGLVY
jgi:hypothetical protein